MSLSVSQMWPEAASAMLRRDFKAAALGYREAYEKDRGWHEDDSVPFTPTQQLLLDLILQVEVWAMAEPSSPSSTRVVCSDSEDSDDDECDEESLVNQSYGRGTYNFGDTLIGPVYKSAPEDMAVYDEIWSSSDEGEIDYP
jgi:hypothetical protein